MVGPVSACASPSATPGISTRQLDKSSTKLEEACANGTFYDQVDIHFCTTVGDAQEPYLKYTLHDVIVTSYSFHGTDTQDPSPSEEITLSFTEAEITYVVIGDDGNPKGNVPVKLSLKERK